MRCLFRIQVRTLTKPLQSLHFVFPQSSRGGLAGVFWIIVLLQNPSLLQLEVTNRLAGHSSLGVLGRQQNSWLKQVFQVLEQQNSLRPSH